MDKDVVHTHTHTHTHTHIHTHTLEYYSVIKRKKAICSNIDGPMIILNEVS